MKKSKNNLSGIFKNFVIKIARPSSPKMNKGWGQSPHHCDGKRGGLCALEFIEFPEGIGKHPPNGAE